MHTTHAFKAEINKVCQMEMLNLNQNKMAQEKAKALPIFDDEFNMIW